jgi:putative heme-binding domain-containing protein
LKQLQSSLSGNEVQRVALQTVCSRSEWSKLLLDEIKASRIAKESIAVDLVQQMRLHEDTELQERIQKLWGQTRASPEATLAKIEEVRNCLREAAGDFHRGQEVFSKKCAVCHRLFGEGGKAGPDLTGYERDNLNFMLPSVIDPSSAIREEFTQFQVLTDDGRVILGLIEQRDDHSVTLRKSDNQIERIDRENIETLQASSQSMMPDGLLNDLTVQQVRDLFAYVTAKGFAPRQK